MGLARGQGGDVGLGAVAGGEGRRAAGGQGGDVGPAGGGGHCQSAAPDDTVQVAVEVREHGAGFAHFTGENTEVTVGKFVDHGKIIPQNILDIPAHKTLNVHPSLLPKLRGASPIQSAILEEEKTGVTIMRLDEKMDHGPIVAQKELQDENWRTPYGALEKTLGEMGGSLLSEILPDWVSGKIVETEQKHEDATYTKKIEKTDGLISLNDDAEKNLRKIKAFSVWPGTYFFTQHKGKEIRVIITDAEKIDGKLEIKKVIPESKKEMSYRDFLKG